MNDGIMRTIRWAAIVLGLSGMLAFGLAFSVSLLDPGFVEEVGKDLVRRQVEQKIHEKIERLDEQFLSTRAGYFMKNYEEEIAAVKQKLEAGLPEKIAGVIAEMRNLDCECRKKIELGIRDDYFLQISNAKKAQEKLTTLIRTRYMETARQLTREFRIFTGTNALAFALLALAGLMKKKASVHLLPGALVLLVATGITAFLYLFNQDWLHTLVFSDYLGFGYVAYLSLAFALLGDVVFNRARVTCKMLSSLGGSLAVAPC